MITATITAVHISDWDLGNALMQDVLNRQKRAGGTADKPGFSIITTPNGSRIGWYEQCEQLYPDEVVIARAANVLMNRRS